MTLSQNNFVSKDEWNTTICLIVKSSFSKGNCTEFYIIFPTKFSNTDELIKATPDYIMFKRDKLPGGHKAHMSNYI